MQWLVDEGSPVDDGAIASMAEADRLNTAIPRGNKEPASLAVRLNDIVIHNTKKWFGLGANIRIDALLVTGVPPKSGDPFYHPSTFRFPNVHDGDRLPIEPPGLLAFYGLPVHFLDIFILVSRDRADSEELGALIEKQVNSKVWQNAATVLGGLALAAPQAAMVPAALGAAATLGNFAASVLRATDGGTIGLYRSSFLQHRDRFGLGNHPKSGLYTVQDLSFRFDIVVDRKAARLP